MKTEYVIDGGDFSTLEEFYDIVSRTLVPGAQWGRNLDAFNDILRGGFGTPEHGFTLRWKNADLSRRRLGYAETCRELERNLLERHRSNRERVAVELEEARRGVGPTVFDWLVEIIADHGDGGTQAHDAVILRLE